MTLTTYDQDTYRQPFEDDLLGAKVYIGIRSPYLSKKAIERTRWLVYEARSKNVRVCVVTEEPWYVRSNYRLNPDEERDKNTFLECVQLLVNMGVHVTLVPKIHEKIIVIDYRILWKGSINVLSNDPTKKTETVERETDLFQVTSAFYRFNFDACVTCQNIEWSKIRGALSVSSESIDNLERGVDLHTVESPANGNASFQERSFARPIQDIDEEPVWKWIAALRESRKVSLTELAKRTAIDRTHLGRLESGRAFPTLRALVALFEVFGYSLVMVPTETVPLVRKIAKGYNRTELSSVIAQLNKTEEDPKKGRAS